METLAALRTHHGWTMDAAPKAVRRHGVDRQRAALPGEGLPHPEGAAQRAGLQLRRCPLRPSLNRTAGLMRRAARPTGLCQAVGCGQHQKRSRPTAQKVRCRIVFDGAWNHACSWCAWKKCFFALQRSRAKKLCPSSQGRACPCRAWASAELAPALSLQKTLL